MVLSYPTDRLVDVRPLSLSSSEKIWLKCVGRTLARSVSLFARPSPSVGTIQKKLQQPLPPPPPPHTPLTMSSSDSDSEVQKKVAPAKKAADNKRKAESDSESDSGSEAAAPTKQAEKEEQEDVSRQSTHHATPHPMALLTMGRHRRLRLGALGTLVPLAHALFCRSSPRLPDVRPCRRSRTRRSRRLRRRPARETSTASARTAVPTSRSPSRSSSSTRRRDLVRRNRQQRAPHPQVKLVCFHSRSPLLSSPVCRQPADPLRPVPSR